MYHRLQNTNIIKIIIKRYYSGNFVQLGLSTEWIVFHMDTFCTSHLRSRYFDRKIYILLTDKEISLHVHSGIEHDSGLATLA